MEIDLKRDKSCCSSFVVDFGINETNRMINYVGLFHIHALYTWQELTAEVNAIFERECTSYMNGEQGSIFINACFTTWPGAANVKNAYYYFSYQ